MSTLDSLPVFRIQFQDPTLDLWSLQGPPLHVSDERALFTALGLVFPATADC